MKTKLLLFFCAFSFCHFSVNAQNQKLWAYAQAGGINNGGTLVSMDNDGTGFSVAHSFEFVSGSTPEGNLLLASDGNIYGNCYDGGAYASCVLFRYDPRTEIYTDVWDYDITNGDFPMSGLVEGGNGKLYGASSGGGLNSVGVIYSYDLASSLYTNLFAFTGPTGANPYGAPVLLGNTLYGMTTSGGTFNAGVIYSYNLSTNVYADIYNFSGNSDGGYPYGSLIQGTDGNLYGMASLGGLHNAGVIFKFNLIGNTYTVIHDFDSPGGATPYASLMQGNDGKLYGTTSGGGSYGGGVLFSYDLTNNTYTNLCGFTPAIGSYPQGDLSQDNNGIIFGTTATGGTGDGNIFKFDPSTGVCSSFMSFNYATTGNHPNGGALLTASTVGINQVVSSANSLSVFPNPANDVLNISFHSGTNQNASFTLKNMLGEEVVAWEAENITDTYKKQVDVSALASGVYLLEVKSGEQKSVQKIIIK